MRDGPYIIWIVSIAIVSTNAHFFEIKSTQWNIIFVIKILSQQVILHLYFHYDRAKWLFAIMQNTFLNLKDDFQPNEKG